MNMNRTRYTPIGGAVAAEVRAELARQQIGISDLAERVGMARTTLSRKINKTGAFTPAELSRIGHELGTSAADLMRRAETVQQKAS
ncbi:helix-turn-helix domain-containing protein [Bowdeniella massiliensis]|uniref:helix-turn-helix domain-containing protein n=1 Tax=Bowdeniella massiliensis TaxID=2932264 RepID=UPI0020286FB4|nr:helix-turn-helix transcriptional regulator [Bowdeniella massiliensis]